MHGEIEKALLLADRDNIRQSYTYTVASALPYYFTTAFATTKNSSTPFLLDSNHFVSASVTAELEILTAIARLKAVSGIGLTGVGSGGDIQIIGTDVDLYGLNATNPVGGFAYPPDWSETSKRNDLFLTSQSFMVDNFGSVQRVVSHELNHTIGLVDANNITALSADERNQRFTVMGYISHAGGLGQVNELQLYDIAALQSLYGHSSAIDEANVYSEFTTPSDAPRAFAIWDGAGEGDSIDVSGQAASALIDLRPGHFSSIGPTTGVSASVTNGVAALTSEGYLNVSIAFGSYIENATGTSHNDFIIGNRLSNVIDGGVGNDIIFGDGEDSVYDPGIGDYRQSINTGTYITSASSDISDLVDHKWKQVDVIHGGDGNDFILGGGGSDELYGDAGNDIVKGGEGNNEIYGGTGNDLLDTGPVAIDPDDAPFAFESFLDGGDGNDILIFRGWSSGDGGDGSDMLYVMNTAPGTNVFIDDADAGDTLFWNGHQITGAYMAVLDAERIEIAEDTYMLYLDVAAIDSKGFIYRFVGSGSDILKITAPDNSTIEVHGYQPGDLGLSITKPSNDAAKWEHDGQGVFHLETSLPLSNIVNDGQWQDYDGLAGRAATGSVYGSVIEPVTYLIA